MLISLCMPKLSIEEVEHIAKLSKLNLTDPEKELYSEQLSSILDYAEKLKEIDTENVEMTANVTGLVDVYRTDAVIERNIPDSDIEKNAPEFKDGSFVVPGVFE